MATAAASLLDAETFSASSQRDALSLSVAFVGVLMFGGCRSHCDPDEIFDTEIMGPDWTLCGDLHEEADRAEATICLEQAFDDGIPAYVRLSDERGILYFYFDAQSIAGVLGWAGRLGRMGDVVYHFHPCDAATAIDAFANYEQIDKYCSDSGEELCP
jgi:hypothetical protein